MNVEWLKGVRVKSQHLVTGLAGVFALVSVQNIAHFFIELHHPFLASWTLGLAIGTALVVLAHLLSEIDMRERKAFWGLLSVTIVLVTLSGIIQGVTYSAELGAVGYVLAFVLAATGEIVLPLAHSWHHEAKRRQAVRDAGQRVEEIAAETMVKVMSNADTTKAQHLAEKRIEDLIVANLDEIVRKLMPKNASKYRERVAAAAAPVAKKRTQSEVARMNEHFGPQNLADANDVRSSNRIARRAALRVILENHGPLSRAKVAERLKDEGFNVGGDQITDDLKAIGAVIAGRKWEAPEPVLNGVSMNGVG